ncbi:dTDP-4-dehydrorhamnose 3,5-epimerase [Desulfovibrio sp. DV]|uniref:dTDP-4-dehydrorhamnose 3,5-epimerase n=1 Tax=Desulfovibrio sp. DV TaxID=1844708 RepID=UPI00094B8AAA|nr:dTDP-4-dehydrorhamnose 3,5-epimerase [Desulfovibrio sp. DV]OLN29899.1 dTDP-4-dehydrorhamnose 3,5-epimerase [Desulfovibrio sp. DV]
MEVSQTGIPGLVVVKPRVFGDHRGFFLETYSREAYARAGLDYDFVQDNHARSGPKGVLRGLHFQLPPATQAKLVWVTRGAVFDAVVDLRVGSPTYGKWYGIELSADNFLRLMVPRGFAHGYVTLTEDAEFMYKVDAPYTPAQDAGIAWNDPEIGVSWPVTDPILSEKDAVQPRLADVGSPFTYAP